MLQPEFATWKGQKAGYKTPAFVDKSGIIGYKSSFENFEFYIPIFMYLYENFYICFYVF